MAIADISEHTDALLTALQATGVLVGDAAKPASSGWQGVHGASPFVGYAILYTLRPESDGPIRRSNDDLMLDFQLTCVGANRLQCQQVSDKLRTAMLDAETRSITVAGRKIAYLSATTGGLGVTRDDSVVPHLYFTADRFQLMST